MLLKKQMCIFCSSSIAHGLFGFAHSSSKLKIPIKLKNCIFMGSEMNLVSSQSLLGANLVFVSSRSLKTRELSFAQFGNFLRKVCLFFNFDIIVNFIIQKLKNKHTFLKKPLKVATLLSLAKIEK